MILRIIASPESMSKPRGQSAWSSQRFVLSVEENVFNLEKAIRSLGQAKVEIGIDDSPDTPATERWWVYVEQGVRKGLGEGPTAEEAFNRALFDAGIKRGFCPACNAIALTIGGMMQVLPPYDQCTCEQ